MTIDGFFALNQEHGGLSLPRLAAFLRTAGETPLTKEEGDRIIARQLKKLEKLNAEIAALQGTLDAPAPDTAEWEPFADVDKNDDFDETPLEKLEWKVGECEDAVADSL